MLDQLSHYTIPVIHPVVVHIPIVLSVVAVLFALGWLMRDRLFWMGALLWIEVIAWLGALIASSSGELMEEQSEGIAIVDEFVHFHEEMGERATWMLGITVVWLVAARWLSARDTDVSGARSWIRWLTLLLVLGSAILMGITAHTGGIMTWGVPV